MRGKLELHRLYFCGYCTAEYRTITTVADKGLVPCWTCKVRGELAVTEFIRFAEYLFFPVGKGFKVYRGIAFTDIGKEGVKPVFYSDGNIYRALNRAKRHESSKASLFFVDFSETSTIA